MTSRNIAQQMLDHVLPTPSFKRRGSRWISENDDLIQLIELQQSQFGEQFYVNIGLWLKALGNPTKIQEKDMHVRLRVDGLLQSIHREQLARALDFDCQISTNERGTVIDRIFGSSVIPYLEEWRSLEGVKRGLAAGDLSEALVRREARAFLLGS